MVKGFVIYCLHFIVVLLILRIFRQPYGVLSVFIPEKSFKYNSLLKRILKGDKWKRAITRLEVYLRIHRM